MISFVFLFDLCNRNPEIHYLAQTAGINVRYFLCNMEIEHPSYVAAKAESEKDILDGKAAEAMKEWEQFKKAEDDYEFTMEDCKKDMLLLEWLLFSFFLWL